jgi:hypothetical protein
MAMEWSSVGSSLAMERATADETIPDNETAENAEARLPLDMGDVLLYTLYTVSHLSSGDGNISETSLAGL